jgi:hypothetical protein
MRARGLPLLVGFASLLFARPAVADPTWTVLGYVAADNDLEAASVQNVAEMAKVGSGGALRVVLQVDRALKHDKDPFPGGAKFSGTRRMIVQPGKAEVLEDLRAVDATQASSIADFIAWGLDKYPSDRVAIVFWDHGAAWAGCCSDETHGRPLTPVTDILGGLKQGLSRAKRAKVDLLGFDECLMASLEVAHGVAPFADVLVASEETEPGEGWDYAAWLGAIAKNPSIDGLAVGRAIADGFAANVKAQSKTPTFTLSVVDLRKLGAVTDATDKLAGALTQGAGARDGWTKIAQARARADGFGREGGGDPFEVIDLGMFAKKMDSPEAKELTRALDAAVAYKVAGKAHEAATGLSVHLPAREVEKEYGALPFAKTKWGAFLGAYTKTSAQDGTPPDIKGVDDDPSGDADVVTATTSDDDVDVVHFVVAKKDGTLLGALPVVEGVPADGKLIAKWDGIWPMVGDVALPMLPVDAFQDDDGRAKAIVGVPADVDPDGTGWQRATLLFEIDVERKSGDFLGAYDAAPNEALDDGAAEIDLDDPAAKVRPRVVTLVASGEPKDADGTREIPARGLALVPRRLAPGAYAVGFLAKDLAGNEATALTDVRLRDGGFGRGCGFTAAVVSASAVLLMGGAIVLLLILRRVSARR